MDGGFKVATANGDATKCAAGTAKSAHTVNYGSTSSCEGCSKGYYSLEGATTCTQCPAGYRDGNGTTDQSKCVKSVSDGYKVATANGDATKCAAGTYKASHNVNYGDTSSCADCSKGYYSLEGATTCTQCPAGYRDGSKGKKESDCIKNVDVGYKVATAKGSATTCSTGYTSAAHNVNYGATSSCTPINYTVTISVNNSNYGTVNKTSLSIPYGSTYNSSGSTITFSNGSSVTGTVTPSTGYTTSFSSWSSTSGTITGDTTITANFNRVGNNYSVIYNCNGGTPINNYSSNHVYGTASNLTTSQCVKTGNIFSGWKDSNNNSYTNGQSITTLVSENGGSITLTAQWTAISYTIAFANGGGSGSMSSINATYNQVVTLPNNTFTRTNYKFTGWSGSNNVNYANGAEVSGLTTTNGATITMTANWVQSVPGTYVKFDGTYYAWWSGSDCTATNGEDSCSINYCSTVGIAQKEMYVTEIKGSVVHGWFYEGNLESEGAGGDCVRGHCADDCKQRYKNSYQTMEVDGKKYVKIQIVDQDDYQFRCKINGVGCR